MFSLHPAQHPVNLGWAQTHTGTEVPAVPRRTYTRSVRLLIVPHFPLPSAVVAATCRCHAAAARLAAAACSRCLYR